MKYIKNKVWQLLNAFGYDIHRSNTRQLFRALELFEVDLVLDVGANVGQFVTELRAAGFRGKVVSFEPLSSAWSALKHTARHDASWEIGSRCAIGDFNGEIEINIAGNSASSSILPMLEAHSSAAEGSAYVGSERVPIFKLDSVASKYLMNSRKPFLKIDTQGFEWQVLDGASEILPLVQGVLCELSLVPLYESQRLWQDIIRRLENDGFKLWSIHRGFTDPRDGRTLQIDATFFRS